MLALAPLFPAALDRQYLSELLACDAAPEFGFGVSALFCGKRTVQQVGRLSERRGDYVRLLPDESFRAMQECLPKGPVQNLDILQSATSCTLRLT